MRTSPSLLDDVLPDWTVREVHAHALPAALNARDLMRACEEVTWGEVPMLRRLMLDRFTGAAILPREAILADFTGRGPYTRLGDAPGETVIGMRFRWTSPRSARTTPRSFPASPTPGDVRVALSVRAEPYLLVTETRVQACGRGATLGLLAYWALIRGPSGLVRRRWLRAVVKRATANQNVIRLDRYRRRAASVRPRPTAHHSTHEKAKAPHQQAPGCLPRLSPAHRERPEPLLT